MASPTVVIVNPESNGGRTRKRWPSLAGRLRDAVGELEIVETDGPGGGERAAREAARAGAERIVVVGGDGSLSEAATGVIDEGFGDRVSLGWLPMGTGCDFGRTVGVSRDPETAIAALARGARRRVDVGAITFEGEGGVERTRFFLNVASFGLSGLTDLHVARAGRTFGPTAAFLIGSLRAIRDFEPPCIALDVDGEQVFEGEVAMVVAANGRYFGSGMKIAPEAEVDDGLLTVLVVARMAKPRLVANLPSLYRGTHVSHPAVSVRSGKRVTARTLRGEALLDVDGEPLGALPATIEIVPSALELFGVDAP
ncbi:MAG: YegS/Rv2252/BmrU family lipid kinase [Actinomycetota bacterium]|nr:YegS/Rv2252/BmrU family lipid kinase [Actinomycetota bacterium]